MMPHNVILNPLTIRMLVFVCLGLILCTGTNYSLFAYAYQLQLNQDSQVKWQCDSRAEVFPCKVVSNENDIGKSRSLHRRRFCAAAISYIGCSMVDGYNDKVANAADVVGNGIIRSKGCYQGTGDGCAELSENNPLIEQLQQQSVKNRERNEKEALYAYYMKNYPDFFNSIGQVLIKKSSDNTFLLVTPQEAEGLKQLGRLTLEIPKTRGGTIVDYTQKPILVLKE